ncbi:MULTISPECIES: hypothetical protein [Paenibacillus]|uniref:hypothetical protein n=1 Tax=Paenibacillus TaxID=44249 RepID=UPI00096FCB09|nr:hypothetical protein [Paenibacillus peoriae]OMF72109.1 hypothetical protein BK145_26175 [Paenibacillus peoriae]
MGYNIGIGEAILHVDKNDGQITVEIERVEVAEAPVWELPENDPFPDLVGKGNFTYPSNSGFARFSSATGLKDVLFNFDSTATTLIKDDDLKIIRRAKEQWITDHPKSIAGWRRNEDDILAKLIWYEFWFEWALNNCKIPAIQCS